MYDEPSFIGLMREAGFTNAKVRTYLDSGLPNLGEVEFPGRLLNGNGFAIEATKT
jgi:hypothetical protein